jgi:hypothetical protein
MLYQTRLVRFCMQTLLFVQLNERRTLWSRNDSLHQVAGTTVCSTDMTLSQAAAREAYENNIRIKLINN